MHRHKFKLHQVGTWFYVWQCDCLERFAISKTFFKGMMLGKIR